MGQKLDNLLKRRIDKESSEILIDMPTFPTSCWIAEKTKYFAKATVDGDFLLNGSKKIIEKEIVQLMSEYVEKLLKHLYKQLKNEEADIEKESANLETARPKIEDNQKTLFMYLYSDII